MEISAEKGKPLVTCRIQAEEANSIAIKFGGKESEEVYTFQHLGSALNEDRISEHQIKKRLAIDASQLSKMNCYGVPVRSLLK